MKAKEAERPGDEAFYTNLSDTVNEDQSEVWDELKSVEIEYRKEDDTWLGHYFEVKAV